MRRIESWDELFMRHAYLVAARSKDTKTRIGAVLVRDGDFDPISSGYNGFPRRISDAPERYADRELKRSLVVHAEANAILNAARKGVSTVGATLYTQAWPCHECGKAIVQAGVAKVVVHAGFPDMAHGPWADSCRLGRDILGEAGIPVVIFIQELGVKAFVDGREHDV